MRLFEERVLFGMSAQEMEDYLYGLKSPTCSPGAVREGGGPFGRISAANYRSFMRRVGRLLQSEGMKLGDGKEAVCLPENLLLFVEEVLRAVKNSWMDMRESGLGEEEIGAFLQEIRMLVGRDPSIQVSSSGERICGQVQALLTALEEAVLRKGAGERE